MGHVPFTFLKPRTKGSVTSRPSQSSPIRMKWMKFGVRIIRVSKRCLQKKITSFLSVISHVTYIMLLLQVQPSKSHGIGYYSATSTIFSPRQFSRKSYNYSRYVEDSQNSFFANFFFFLWKVEVHPSDMAHGPHLDQLLTLPTTVQNENPPHLINKTHPWCDRYRLVLFLLVWLPYIC